ncbi:MAG: hypothetical protein ACRDC3_12175 [Paraclostridium dentum]|uniref:hypothetical protein n=1 Tax=Paraclostridium dentum TaxID=2662455 RepID=UPI003EE78FBB
MKKIQFSTLFKIILILFFSFIVVISHKDIENLSIVDTQFLITFLVSILGIALTVSAIMYSFVEKFVSTIDKIDISKSNIDKLNFLLDSLLDELKEDTLLVLKLLALIVFLSVFEGLDIPLISFQHKHIFIQTLRVSSILLSIYTIRDIILVVFKVLKLR